MILQRCDGETLGFPVMVLWPRDLEELSVTPARPVDEALGPNRHGPRNNDSVEL